MSTIVGSDSAKLTVADRLFKELCDEIVTGKIEAGSKISEPELAKQFDVSRAPLREAITRLEACNLVTRKPNIGARVVELSYRELLEIYHIREALEGMAARLAAENMNEQKVQELRDLLNDETRDDEHGERNHDFHYAIVIASGNARLAHLLCDDLYNLMRMYRHQLGRKNTQASSAPSEHHAILDALQDHDGEMAEMLMRRHIRKSRVYIENLLKESTSHD